MKLSEAGAERIANYEGFVAKAYWDVNHYSIGYGTRARSATEGPITTTEGRRRLRHHADAAVGKPLRAVLAEAKLTLNQNQFDALVIFGFNLGAGSFDKDWQMGAAIRSGDLDAIAEAFLRPSYATSNGQTLAGLVRRRKEEHDLFLKKPPVAYTETERHMLGIIADKRATRTARKRMAASLKRDAAEIQRVARSQKDGWAKKDRARRFQGIRRALKRHGYL